jgi:hypothetical protein
MVIIVFALIITLSTFLFTSILYISKLQKQVNLLDKEQHVQNEDIYKVMKENYELKGMILQHVEILKYLIEQDPKLNTGKKIYFTGPIGEA